MGDSQISLRRFVFTVAAGCVALAGLIAVAAIVTRSLSGTSLRVLGTGVSFAVYSALGAAGAAARERSSEGSALGTATVAVAGLAFLLLFAGIWVGLEPDIWRAFASLTVLTLAGSHACLVLMARRQTDTPLIIALTRASIGAASFLAFMSILGLLGAIDHVGADFARFLAVVAVVFLVTSVLPPILRPAPRELSER